MNTRHETIKKALRITLLFLLLGITDAMAQSYEVANGSVRRVIDVSKGHIVSSEYSLLSSGSKFIQDDTREFSFYVNDRLYTGKDSWKDISARDTSSANGMKGIILLFSNPENTFSVSLSYLTYPGLPLIRKYLEVQNLSDKELKLEGVKVEDMVPGFNCTQSYTSRQYARYKTLGPYVGSWDDPLVIVYDQGRRMGMAVGNEAVGIIKRTSAFEDGRSVCAGVSMPKDVYPFRRWLDKGDSWHSAAVFTVPFEGAGDPEDVVDTSVQTFVRKYMGVRVEQIGHKPLFVYNTWVPFNYNIDEKTINEVAEAAAECGFEEFIIDDGWQTNNGSGGDGSEGVKADWDVNLDKFPHGLKPVFDHIKSLGMKPGLWISVARLNRNNQSAVEHPEWFIVGKDGKLTDLHVSNSSNNYSACMGTDWCDYIRETILRYVREFGLAYAKLDLSIVTSAYIYDSEHTGCYAANHPYHKDHEESYDVIYERCMQLFDDLHREAPDLFIDCTFETAGKLQLMDYGISQHAEGNWLSNVEEPAPYGTLRVRNLAWGHTPALHPTSLVIGNQRLDDPDHVLAYKSLTGTLPIMLGDPRKMSHEERAEMKRWSSWVKGLEQRHGIMSFRQDLPDFGEPREGCWDGFCRINTETCSGGLVGVFRQGAALKTRTVTIPWLKDDLKYAVLSGADGKMVSQGTGRELRETGFPVTLEKEYDGELFEVRAIGK